MTSTHVVEAQWVVRRVGAPVRGPVHGVRVLGVPVGDELVEGDVEEVLVGDGLDVVLACRQRGGQALSRNWQEEEGGRCELHVCSEKE